MKLVYRDILKHSGIYGIAQVVGRLASIAAAAGLHELPVAGGLRLHRHPRPDGGRADPPGRPGDGRGRQPVPLRRAGRGRGRPGLVDRADAGGRPGAGLLVPAWLLRDALARWTLGPGLGRGGFYYALVLPVLWLSVVGELPSMYLRVRKWSGVFLAVSVGAAAPERRPEHLLPGRAAAGDRGDPAGQPHHRRRRHGRPAGPAGGPARPVYVPPAPGPGPPAVRRPHGRHGSDRPGHAQRRPLPASAVPRHGPGRDLCLRLHDRPGDQFAGPRAVQRDLGDGPLRDRPAAPGPEDLHAGLRGVRLRLRCW